MAETGRKERVIAEESRKVAESAEVIEETSVAQTESADRRTELAANQGECLGHRLGAKRFDFHGGSLFVWGMARG